MKTNFQTQTLMGLINWYQKNQRDLPWRKNPNPYWVWLAEVMSQQTQIAALLPYFYRFIERFPTVEVLATAEIDEVLKYWTGLGYYSRARNLHKAAQRLWVELKGKFPRTFEEWVALPGIGPYTAAAISSQCNEWPVAVWDGNVHRVCARFFAEQNSRTEKFKSLVLKNLESQMQKQPRVIVPSKLNQALMELGALVCTVKNPKCEVCPIQNNCKAYVLDEVAEFPRAKPKKKFISIAPKYFILIRRCKENQNEVLLVKRPPGRWFSGLWDFPSELGGVGQPIQKRYFLDKLDKKYFKNLGSAKHAITHHKITLDVYQLASEGLKKSDFAQNFSDFQWVSLEDVYSEQPPIALATTARKVLRVLGKSNFRIPVDV